MSDKAKERYTLRNAAELAAGGDAEGISRLLRKLEQSIHDGSLKVFLPGSKVSFTPGIDDESSTSEQADLIRADQSIYAGGITWVDEQYDARLGEERHRLPLTLEVYWDDLNNWLKNEEPKITWQFPKRRAVEKAADSSRSINDWQAAVREIADELHLKDTGAGAYSSNKDMSDRVAEIARVRKITGPQGQLTAGNILREALQGKRWKRPGENKKSD